MSLDSAGLSFEEQLVDALQPIRGFVIAQALNCLMASGIYEAISGSVPRTVHDVAESLRLDEHRLLGFLRYLANEEYIAFEGAESVTLTARGRRLADFRPWYTLLVGGYAQTFLSLQDALRADGGYADRNSTQVGIGSCGISQHDALPMTRTLVGRITPRCNTIIDIGCGDGSFLVDLCVSLPALKGIGLDPAPESVAGAEEYASRQGVADRVNIRVGAALEMPRLSDAEGPLCFLTAFVLQEVLEQDGRAAIVSMLRDTFARFPDAHWVVIEVDHRPADSQVMGHPLGLAYYNPYYLIHQITEQRLETDDYWRALFNDAGVSVLSTAHPDPSKDSLRLKTGYLLGTPTDARTA